MSLEREYRRLDRLNGRLSDKYQAALKREHAGEAQVTVARAERTVIMREMDRVKEAMDALKKPEEEE